MANQEHVYGLREGAEKCNNRRRAYPEIVSDLEGVTLSKFQLNHINFSLICLMNANLSRASFAQASSAHANLQQTILHKGLFANVCLDVANLNWAQGISANFRGLLSKGLRLNISISIAQPLREQIFTELSSEAVISRKLILRGRPYRNNTTFCCPG